MNSTKPDVVVSLEGVSKQFGTVTVLDGIDFALQRGTITGLVGENGAGKSTLIKILAGAITATRGTVLLGGELLPGSTGAVIQAGLSVIYQELTDVPDMSLLDNVLLGNLASRAGVRRTRLNRQRAREGLRKVGLDHLDLATPIRELTISQRQLAEIARCLVRDAQVLVLDEPSSSLPERDVDTLLAIVERLKQEGLTILYVTHHLNELFRIADRMVVLRDGHLVGDKPAAEWDEKSLVRSMLAKDLENAYPWHPREIGPVVLEATHIHARGVRGASVTAHRGEIVGLVGLAGAGRTELMKAISGIAGASSGTLFIDGTRIPTGNIDAGRRAGVFYAPEDRKKEGLVLGGSIEANLTYSDYRAVSKFGFIRPALATRRAVAFALKYGIKYRSVRQPVGELSGGNQQKVVVARVSEMDPQVVLFDDPTRGVDVGAKLGIWEQIFSLARKGTAIFVSSSDTDEVLAVADRVYVLLAGKTIGSFERADFDREKILHVAAGGTREKATGL